MQHVESQQRNEMEAPMRGTDNVTDTWHQRFDFFGTYGLPSSSPQARDAFKELSWWTRTRMSWNTLAFLFGPIYFFVKGMWRKGLVLLVSAIALGTVMVSLDLPEMVNRAGSLVIPAMAANVANYAYYLHVVMESRSWNPLEGLGRKNASN
jgi:hypothetical protein